QCEDALVNLVALNMQRKDYDRIRKHAERLLKLNPSSQAALEGLSTAAFATEAFAEAAQHYSRLVELYPRNYDYWFNLGVTRQRLFQTLEAATAYENAISVRPDAAGAYVNLSL